MFRQADRDVGVGGTMLLEVLAPLFFIVLPGDPGSTVFQVIQGPVTGTVPGIQHWVRGKLNLEQEAGAF